MWGVILADGRLSEATEQRAIPEETRATLAIGWRCLVTLRGLRNGDAAALAL
jgi:hypothetical protein